MGRIWDRYDGEADREPESCIFTITVTYSKGIKRRGEGDDSTPEPQKHLRIRHRIYEVEY